MRYKLPLKWCTLRSSHTDQIFFVGLFKRFLVKDSGTVRDPDALEQVLGLGRGSQGCHQSRSRSSSKKRHLWRVTSEVVDVQFDPLQGGDYVSEAVVAGGRRVSALGQGVQGEEAEQAAAIVDGHEDDAVVLGESWKCFLSLRPIWNYAHFILGNAVK